MNVAGSTALIAGGASGLGAATARRLVADGANVVIFDLNLALGEALEAELGPSASFIPGNVADEESVEEAIVAAVQSYGNLHMAVNCAGIVTPGRILGKSGPMPLNNFAKVIQVNLLGTFNVLRLTAAAMQQNLPDNIGERGVIINTASIAGYEGQIGQAAYAASKGGVVGLTLPAARDLSVWGIRVVTIAPGIFDTPLLHDLPEETLQSLSSQVPFPSRLGNPNEYAMLVAHIAENTMLNGEVIRLDGALRMGPH